MVSAICSVNNTTLPTSGVTGINVSAGSTITVALTPPGNAWTINCTSTDGLNTNSTISAIQATKMQNMVNNTCTFVVPAMDGSKGASLQFTSTINNDPTTTFTFGVFVLCSNGLRLVFNGETQESNITYGVATDVNKSIAAAGGSGPSTLISTGVATAVLSSFHPAGIALPASPTTPIQLMEISGDQSTPPIPDSILVMFSATFYYNTFSTGSFATFTLQLDFNTSPIVLGTFTTWVPSNITSSNPMTFSFTQPLGQTDLDPSVPVYLNVIGSSNVDQSIFVVTTNTRLSYIPLGFLS